MPTSKEFTIQMEDSPGTLGKFCRALADNRVNIVAFQATVSEGKGLIRLVADNPPAARTALDDQKLTYAETEVAQIELAHRPGELARAASRLGDAGININYAYSGVESRTHAPLLIFGVREVGQAVKILEQAAGAATGS